MADRTVTVKLRAQVGDFVAEMNLAGAAVDGFGKKVDGTSKKTDESFKKTDESLKKTSQSTQRSTTQMRDHLISLGAAAVGLSVPVGAAGTAFLAMAAVAVPSIAKVVSAQQNLGVNWDTLDRRQKIAAVSVASLIGDYKALAKSYEPQALAQFNGLVATAHGLLPELRRTVDSTSQGMTDFGASVEGTLNRQLPRLFGILRGQATPALHELGTTFDETTGLAVNLVQGLAPMGMTFLHSANGALMLLNALTSIDPRLTEFAGTAIALRSPVMGLTGFVTSMQGRFKSAAETTAKTSEELGRVGRGARVAAAAEKGLNAVTSLGPGLYIAAAAGLAYLAVRLSNVRTATDGVIDKLRGQYQAFGNNIAGYARYSAQLRQMVATEQAAFDDLRRRLTNPGNPHPVFEAPERLTKLKAALDSANRAQRNITQGAAELGKEFGLTSQQAIQLANAAGVDMSKGILKSGQVTEQARQKLTQYEAAVAAASNPTQRIAEDMKQAANTGLLMKDRITAVTDALSAYYTPATAAWDATTALKQGMQQLAAAMRKAHGDFSGNTTDSQKLRTALSSQLNVVAQLYQANLQTKGYKAAHAAADRQVQVMYALAGRSKAARAEIDTLAKSLGLSVGKANLSHHAFIQAARSMGESKAAAEKLWTAYKKLQTPVKLNVDDRDFLRKLHAAQGLKIDPKTGLLKGDNADYLNKWLKVHHLKIDPKTGLLKGDNNSYLSKWLTVHHLRIDTKTGRITGDTSAFWNAVHNIPSTVGYRKIGVYYVPMNSANEPGHTRHARGGIVRRAAGGPVQHMAAGGPSGYVTGPGTTTSDSILTALSNKEFVINAASTARYRPWVEAINNGQLEQFIRHLVRGAAPATAFAHGSGSGGVAPQITQVFPTQEMSPGQLAQYAARELAWTLAG